jgi:hypothetical protein
MAKVKRIYSAPLVVTVAAWVGPACSGNASDSLPNASGGTVEGSGSGRSTGGANAGGGPGQSGGNSTGGKNQGVGGDLGLPDCPTDLHYFYYSSCEPERACKAEMSCTSGIPQTVTLVCRESGQGYMVLPTQDLSCDHPFDACVKDYATMDCLEDTWHFQGGGGNPPAPCPETLPAEGSECNFGFGFGADREACGYPCQGSGWTITGCVSQGTAGAAGESSSSRGAWESDGACGALGGNGGE